nr:hypothetical protein Itr_chr14CG29340 [Ipomoea trifida]
MFVDFRAGPCIGPHPTAQQHTQRPIFHNGLKGASKRPKILLSAAALFLAPPDHHVHLGPPSHRGHLRPHHAPFNRLHRLRQVPVQPRPILATNRGFHRPLSFSFSIAGDHRHLIILPRQK